MVCFFWQSCCFADVKSTNGIINFDVDSDGQPEARLIGNSLGIGIGNPSSTLHVSGNSIVSQQVILGDQNSSDSNLHLNGTLSHSFQTLSESGTISSDHSIVFVDTSGSNLLLDLPPASVNEGMVLHVKNINNSNKTFLRGGGNYIDGQVSISLINDSSTMAHAKLISSGGNWLVLSESGLTANTDPASDNLIAYYPLDEGSGDSINDAQGSYDGARYGFETSGNGWANGLVGKALDFDGTDDYVLLPGSMINDTSGTISAWVKTTDGVNSIVRHIVYAGSGNGDGLGGEQELHLNMEGNSGDPQFFLEATAMGADVNTNAVGSLNDGLWHHIVATWDGNIGIVYQDGQYRDSDNYTPVGYTCTLATLIGSHSNRSSQPQRAWKGLIDEVRFYNRALTHSEVTELYQNIVLEEPVLQYDFEEGDGVTTRAEESFSSYLGARTNFETSGNGWVAGKFGSYAIEFDGVNDFVDLPPKGLLSAGNLSVSVWFKTSDSSRRFMFYLASDGTPYNENGYGGGYELHLGIDSPGNVEVFGQGAGNDLFLVSSGTYHDGNWHHAVLSISGTDAKLTVDNTDVDTDTWDNGNDIYSSTNIRIGAPGHNTPERTWNGTLDELKIWNREINDAEIQNLYQLGQ